MPISISSSLPVRKAPGPNLCPEPPPPCLSPHSLQLMAYKEVTGQGRYRQITLELNPESVMYWPCGLQQGAFF